MCEEGAVVFDQAWVARDKVDYVSPGCLFSAGLVVRAEVDLGCWCG